MLPTRRALAAASFLAVATAPLGAGADRIVRGTVVAREANEIYLDIGAGSGAAAGAPLRLRRPIRLKHPVTGAWVADELPIGEASLTQVGGALAMARVPPALYARVRQGDAGEVLIAEAAARPAAPAQAQQPTPEIPVADPATRAVLETWSATAGATLDARIAAWERFLARHPGSQHGAAVRVDLELLYQERRRSPTPVVDDQVAVSGVDHDAPAVAQAGRPLHIAFALRRPADVLAAWVHYRQRGAATYHRAPLVPDGDGYLRAVLPGPSIAAPGVEYFAEVATTQAVVGAAVGRPAAPITVEVEPPPGSGAFADSRHRSRITLTSTYLDFATFDRRGGDDDHEDAFTMFEADFLYRLRSGFLHGIRMGMGAINGRGGHADLPPEEAGFHFGYSEVELRTGRNRAVLARVMAGLGREGLGFGLEGRLRLGPEEGTSLTFAVSSLEEIGFLSEVRMQWAALARLPLGFAVAVTDQPSQGDLGLRLTTDIGWRALDWVQPTVRVSYQGRSVEHSGVGVGAGLVFDW
jgi:hypothetical protein